MRGENWVKVFLQCDVDKWDGAVIETGDRDKGAPGRKQRVPPYDDITTTGSHFDDVEEQLQWISTIHKGTGLPFYFWQAAVGNTYFRTINQTDGHYADTLAQGLLEGYPKNPMISRYVEAGCYGWVFSKGQAFQTAVYDKKKMALLIQNLSQVI